MQNLSQNDLNQITKMHNQSRDELQQIAKMRRIKNYKETSKEGLIKKIKKIFNKLRDMLTKEYRKKIIKKLYEIENQKNLSKLEKEETHDILLNQQEFSIKKNRYHDRDDPGYYGIRGIENLFDKVDEEDYYKPILAKNYK